MKRTVTIDVDSRLDMPDVLTIDAMRELIEQNDGLADLNAVTWDEIPVGSPYVDQYGDMAIRAEGGFVTADGCRINGDDINGPFRLATWGEYELAWQEANE